MGSKGLVVIYDPHNLYEFVWYYCNEGKSKKWDALCLPNAQKGEYMHSYCEASGIFDRIIRNDTGYESISSGKKLSMLASMFVSWVFGQRKAYCHRLLNRFVRLDEYDEIVIIADVGIVSGACCALSEEKKVIILEDGINDYSERPRMIPKTKRRSLYSWQGFLLALMGYCSPGWFYLKTNRDCIKYASQPEKMVYRNYREIRQLYAEVGTDTVLFNELVRRLYPALNNYDLAHTDAVVLTRPLEDFVTQPDKYRQRLEQYIREHYSSILLKKHPREQASYDFGDNVAVSEIDNSIPAEALLPYLVGKEIAVVTTSAIMIYMRAYSLQCRMILFDGMFEESLHSNSKFRAMSSEEAKAFAEQYCAGSYEMVVI